MAIVVESASSAAVCRQSLPSVTIAVQSRHAPGRDESGKYTCPQPMVSFRKHLEPWTSLSGTRSRDLHCSAALEQHHRQLLGPGVPLAFVFGVTCSRTHASMRPTVL